MACYFQLIPPLLGIFNGASLPSEIFMGASLPWSPTTSLHPCPLCKNITPFTRTGRFANSENAVFENQVFRQMATRYIKDGECDENGAVDYSVCYQNRKANWFRCQLRHVSAPIFNIVPRRLRQYCGNFFCILAFKWLPTLAYTAQHIRLNLSYVPSFFTDLSKRKDCKVIGRHVHRNNIIGNGER